MMMMMIWLGQLAMVSGRRFCGRGEPPPHTKMRHTVHFKIATQHQNVVLYSTVTKYKIKIDADDDVVQGRACDNGFSQRSWTKEWKCRLQ